MSAEIKIINEDCMTAMGRMGDNEYSLAIVDPPYGLQGEINRSQDGSIHTKSTVKFGSRFKMGNSYNSKKWDISTPPAEYFTELMRVSKNQIIFGGNYHRLPPCRGFIVWDKMQTVSNFSDCEYIWTSITQPAKIIRHRHQGAINSDGLKIHPTQKPIKLYEKLLTKYAKPGDKILDTHGGSMSIAIACHILGYDLDLYEIDTDYFEAGKARLEEFQKQGALPL